MDEQEKKDNKMPAEQPCYDLDKRLDLITPDNQPESFDDAPVGEGML